MAACAASSVGCPAASSAQPGGNGLPSRCASPIFPNATTPVAMSSTMGGASPAGMAQDRGWLASSGVMLPKAAILPRRTRRPEVANPIMPAAAACIA